MRRLRASIVRLANLFRRDRLDDELAAEMESHLEMHIDDSIRAGMTPEEARRDALLKLGGKESAKEQYRDRRGLPWLESLVRDLAYGLRTLRRNPGFAAVAILTLALGIGANTAIFSLFDAVMLRHLPVHDPQRLVFPQWTAREGWHGSYSDYGGCEVDKPGSGAAGCSFSVPAFELFRSRAKSFSGIAAFRSVGAQAEVRDEVLSVNMVLASGAYFATLGLTPAAGRLFNSSDDRRDANPVVVLSHAFWQKHFGGTQDAAGKSLPVDGIAFTIAGVAPPDFYGLQPVNAPDLWVPLETRWRLYPDSSAYDSDAAYAWLSLIARIGSGIAVDRARAELGLLFRQSLPGEGKGLTPESKPGIILGSATRGQGGLRMQYSRPLQVLMAVVGLLLLIACANIANLMLARASARRKEIAVRLAIGAGRARVVRQLLIESLLITIAGAAVGVLAAAWVTRALVIFLDSGLISNLALDVSPNPSVLLFTAAITGLATMLSGLLPALTGTAFAPGPALKGTGGSVPGNRSKASRFLIVCETATALILLVGAGLFLRTLTNLLGLDPGFRKDHLLTIDVRPKIGVEPAMDPAVRNARLRERFSTLPGAGSATWSAYRFLVGSRLTQDVQLTSRPDLGRIEVEYIRVGPKFFETLNIPILAGRDVGEDDCQGETKSAWVNEELARRYYAGRSPLGDTIPRGKGRLQIVGVVGNIKSTGVRSKPFPAIFLPDTSSQVFLVRTSAPTEAVAGLAQEAVTEVAPWLMLADVRSQEELLDQSLTAERLMARLVTVFGCLALVLAAVGIYGVFAYSIVRRTPEIAVRMSVGATPGEVLWMVLRDGIGLAAAGAAVGLLGAIPLSKRLGEMLFGVEPLDPLTYAVSALALIATAALACYIPARRATRIQPLTALRSE